MSDWLQTPLFQHGDVLLTYPIDMCNRLRGMAWDPRGTAVTWRTMRPVWRSRTPVFPSSVHRPARWRQKHIRCVRSRSWYSGWGASGRRAHASPVWRQRARRTWRWTFLSHNKSRICPAGAIADADQQWRHCHQLQHRTQRDCKHD